MDKIKNLLNDYFGITKPKVMPVKGGWSADAYIVTSDSESYFLKVYDKSRVSLKKYIKQIDVYTPLLSRLNETPAFRNRTPVPICTLNGDYKYEDDGSIYLLYYFVEGSVIGDEEPTGGQVRELAEIVAVLHESGGELVGGFDVEADNFDISFTRQFENEVLPEELMKPESRHAFAESSKSVKELVCVLSELSQKLKKSPPQKVLCHTDLHNYNIMQTENGLVLLDWEGIKLAPAEADFIFVRNYPFFYDFLQVYKTIRKGFSLNPEAMLFYMLKRRLEDISEWHEQVIHEKNHDAAAALQEEIERMHTEYLEGEYGLK